MRYPRHMTLELTAKCNFRCPYCYCLWHEFPEIGKPELDTVGWKNILDKCADDGVEDILFTGGEAPSLSAGRRKSRSEEARPQARRGGCRRSRSCHP